MIRCLGCGEEFFDWEGYRKHKRRADHPDAGEMQSGKSRV